jgi:PHD/YefM family antitoxin component YafN of YafNO toxin-antitoxin module
MTKTMPIMEARRQLTTFPEALMHDGEADVLEVTRRGKPVLAVLPWDLYEAVMETLDIMADQELMPLLRESIGELEAGKTLSWEEAKRELEL